MPTDPAQASVPAAQEDTSTNDLGGLFQRAGKITPRTESGYAEWIALQTPERILGGITLVGHPADGGQGMGLWRRPLDPLLPDSNM